MVSSGYEEIPIISVNASGALVEQPGFEINWLKKLRLLFIVTMYADCIAKMYYATAAREKTPGTAEKVRQHFMKAIRPLILKNDTSGMVRLLDKAVAAFNELPVHGRELPRMGVVGEIYAKYNYFANQDLVHWLMRNGIEPVLPPIVDYFIQDLVNYRENIRSGVRRRKLQDLLGQPIEWLIRYYHHKICRIFSKFRFGIPFDDIHEVAENASRILSMTNQFGEGVADSRGNCRICRQRHPSRDQCTAVRLHCQPHYFQRGGNPDPGGISPDEPVSPGFRCRDE